MKKPERYLVWRGSEAAMLCEFATYKAAVLHVSQKAQGSTLAWSVRRASDGKILMVTGVKPAEA